MPEKTIICSFDIDGVLYNGPGMPSLRPGPNDVIITGRSYEESKETNDFLKYRKITNPVHFQQIEYDKKTRDSSGYHKANTINLFNSSEINHSKIVIHYEDDPVQADIIRKECPDIAVILLDNPLIELSNRRNLDWNKI